LENFPLIFNSIESGIWAAMGVGFLLAAMRHTDSARMRCAFAALVFFFFGASDAVELYTGAWWRPWWLFAWKALCIVSLLGLYVDNLVSRIRRAKQQGRDGEVG